MKSRSVLAIVCLITAMQMWPQSKTGNQSYEEFRKSMLDGYNKFRQSILDDYDKFLEEAWGNYEKFKGEERYSEPKPSKAPQVDPAAPQPDVKPLPRPDKPRKDNPVAGKTPAPKPQPVPAPVAVPEPEAQPAPSAAPVVADEPAYTFPFYSIEFDIKDTMLPLNGRLNSSSDYAAQWRSLASGEAKSVIPELKRIAKENSLNDYLTFEMVRAYVDSRYAQSHPTARVALEHYLLANMGYDVRIAVDGDSTPLLLVPFRQYVYGRPYLPLDNRKYYVFQPRGAELNPNTSILTYKLPSDADCGRPLDLMISELTIPEKMKDFHLSFDGIELNGQVNENIFPIIYHYPQMAMEGYAKSAISPALRADLVSQLKSQLGGLSEAEAVDKLLKFTQSAFEYATDGDFHGFEKPYFLEEILYYPKCDCEDRSIFYTYMLWNVLGLENHLLAYPGHESASVRLSAPVKGTGYDHDGKHFYISDPTYIGSSTGMCMPAFEYTKPDIDYIYK